MNCFCCSGKTFSTCCEPFIFQQKNPTTPEQLMRSRYSAFCKEQADYLVNTHWPIQPESITQINNTIKTTKWSGLKIVASPQPLNDEGIVEFVAFFEENGTQQLHEKSRFKKIDDRWFYVDGKHLPPIKLNRNDACFCGSGKKQKKCHGI